MSIRLVHYKKKLNASGLAPIYLKMNIAGKISYLSTGHFIHERQWDKISEMVKDSHPLAEQINTDILQRKKEAVQSLLTARVRGQRISSSHVKEQVQAGNNFFKFAEAFSESVTRKRKPLTLGNYEKHLRKLETFNGSRVLMFEDITPEYLTEFENWIEDNTAKRGDTSNYAFAIMKTIRTFCNAARKKGVTDYYPFSDYEMPDETPGDKEHLTLAELDLWTKHYRTITDPVHKQAALYFLFGCYSGLRISDWYLFTDKKVQKDYITLRAKKNGERVSVPMTKRLRFVLDEMKKVPLTAEEPTLNRTFKKVAEGAEIDKYLSSHSARKTFAVTMCLERGVSSETAAELMGITLATFVRSYSKVTPEKVRRETAKAWKGL